MTTQPAAKKEEAYTMKEALKDASDMLKAQFGESDQQAAVALAIFLHGAHAKDVFMKQRQNVDERAFM